MSSIITQALGDYKEDFAKLNFAFLTLNLTTGVPTALVSGVMSVYKGSNTTQSTAGVTLNADYDAVTGLNHVLIDLSADAFYAADEDYFVVITTGTVNSVSVVGTVVATFSIAARSQQAANVALQVTADAIEAGVITNAAGTDVAADIIALKTTADAIETDTGEIGTAGAGLTDLGGMATGMIAEVNAACKDVIDTDTHAELAQGTPGATVSLTDMVLWLYKLSKNQVWSTSSQISVYNNAAAVVDAKSPISDDTTTGKRGKFVAGP